MQVERHHAILARLDGAGSVLVSELSSLLGVTTETIRRDLSQLQGQGRLTKTHGGAVRAGAGPTSERPFHQRQRERQDIKQRLATQALTLIEAGQVIGLDASTTCLELAKLLPDVPITVVCNAPAVCHVLADRRHVRVVCTGGELDPQTLAFTGRLAEQAAAGFALDRLFISCVGIDARRGFGEASDPHARLKLALMNAARRTHVLADASKLDILPPFPFAKPARVTSLITDASSRHPVARALRRQSPKLQWVRVESASVKTSA